MSPLSKSLTTTENRILSVFVIAHPDDESMFFLPTIAALSSSSSASPDCKKYGTNVNGNQKSSIILTSNNNSNNDKEKKKKNEKKKKKDEKWIICLSRGNYDGLGNVRQHELYKVCEEILNFDKIILVNVEEALPDSPTRRWSCQVISRYLEKYLLISSSASASVWNEIHIYTFDEGGVSGHVNHIDTHYGVLLFLKQQQGNSFTIKGWQLETIRNPIQKYIPKWLMYSIAMIVVVSFLLLTLIQTTILLIIVTTIWSYFPTRAAKATITNSNKTTGIQQICTMWNPRLNWQCMAAHASQFVWYRRLFVIFSAYTYENRFSQIYISNQQENTTSRSKKQK